MVKVKFVVWRYIGRRSQSLVFLLLAIFTAFLMVKMWWWLAVITGEALAPPPPPAQDLNHLRRERSLKSYLDSIQLFIEPSVTPCEGLEGVPLLVLVTTGPENIFSRMAIRETWGRKLPTYFVTGLDESENDDQLSNIYLEAKQFSDLIVFDLVENYQNLTLKTALMLQWAARRCPHAGAVMKTDDDVLVNPWVMKSLVKEHADHQLVGYKRNQTLVHRDEYTKWYMPRWVFPQDTIPEYLSGTGYIIYGEYIERILKGAYHVPLVNLEDVYFTFMVAKDQVSLTLTHDRRVSPYKPWIRASCAYWGLAATHSLAPKEIRSAWARIGPLGEDFERGENVCGWFSFLSGDFFLV